MMMCRKISIPGYVASSTATDKPIQVPAIRVAVAATNSIAAVHAICCSRTTVARSPFNANTVARIAGYPKSRPATVVGTPACSESSAACTKAGLSFHKIGDGTRSDEAITSRNAAQPAYAGHFIYQTGDDARASSTNPGGRPGIIVKDDDSTRTHNRTRSAQRLRRLNDGGPGGLA